MKIFIYLIILILISGCTKENRCSKLPDGTYSGWFRDDGSTNSTFNSNLQLKVIDQNTISINAVSTSQYTLNKQGCSIHGKTTVFIGSNYKDLEINAEIDYAKNKYLIRGDYSYLGYNGGMGNPQYYEVQGTFEINSN